MRRNSFFSDVGRTISWHRRKLAVVAALAAVLSGISAVTPPDPPTTAVVVTAADLVGGVQLGAGDVETRQLPSSAVPQQTVSDPAAVIGRTLVAPLPAGSILTGLSVLADRGLTDPGQVIAPVRISDASVLSLLRVGDRIDIVVSDGQSGKSSILARDVRVVTLPRSEQSSTLGVTSGDGGDAQLVLLAVTEAEATALTQASEDKIGVILH